ncbi:GNAT family N-acetyltransferase [Zeaxanthinibacter sp. PT1]|uniref:GNAT family N-acetyltransferase n=1 Tax=Zeaxanthinibacter TaxID=561554 RepID=UPI00234B40FE|nr:GNAT family N-acetyltransferase [Zeaxanthinibacter sp. PT1]MDC6350835.1 GNAT family N-acetyltransferase [Zeaxanthinibacter sp. PT1]
MIRRAKILEIPDILAITRACTEDMFSKGILQWNESYPNPEVLTKDINRRELYILEEDGIIKGLVVLTTIKDPEYEDIRWLSPEGFHGYVHRLAVHPQFQRNGLAGKLMDYVEDKARETGMVSIRLDTFSQNPGNQRFYESRGYTRLGSIDLPEQSPYPFYCYELELH